jgi:uncharacterized membrane protein YfcA
MEWYLILAVIGVGIIAGFINTVAGSGSLLTLPLLMFLGLPANVANGTNRIGILLHNIVGSATFRQHKVLNLKEGLRIGIPATLGSLIGARIAINMDEAIMTRTIGCLLVIMFFLILFNPDRWIKSREGHPPVSKWIQIPVFFLIGIYGGFIQAGVGFFLLAGLVLGAGFDLVKANALKVFIVLLYTPFALLVFILNDQVDYKLGLILAAGNIIGAFLGAKYAVKVGARTISYFVLVALALATLYLFGVFDLIF